MTKELTEVTWTGVACAVMSAVVIPLLLRRIFFFKKLDHKSSTGNCSFEKYMNNHGMSEVDAKFQIAVDFIAARGNDKMTNEQKLTLYAFYKQALSGRCEVERPSRVDIVGLAKWESWKALGDMSQEVAKRQYFEWVQDLSEGFDAHGLKKRHSSSDSLSEATNESVSSDNYISMAGAVSLPKVDMSTEEWTVKDDIFHYASTGDVDKLVSALKTGECINAQDHEGRTMMHWAVDRDQQSIVKELLRRNASPNIQDADGMTPLHYAANCDHEEMAQLLVKHGAQVDVEDLDGDTPLTTTSSQALHLIMTNGATRGL